MQPRNRPRHIVRGQNINPEKAEAARRLCATMTTAEQVLWQHLRRNALTGLHFRRQQVIEGYIVDFYCHRAALVVECDGAGHDAIYDAARDAVLAQQGIFVLRFSNDKVLKNTPHVLRRIQETAQERQNLRGEET